MFINSQTVETILIFCKHFELNDETSFSILDTYANFAKHWVGDTKESFAEKVQMESKRTRPQLLADVLQQAKSEALKSIQANALLSILLTISLCTKSIEGPRHKMYIDLKRFIVLLQRTGCEHSLQSLVYYEFEIFKYISYRIEQPKAYYTMTFNVRECAVAFNYSFRELQDVACQALRLIYLKRNAINDTLRPKVVPQLYEQFCTDRALMGITAVYTAIVCLDYSNNSKRRQVLELIAAKNIYPASVITTVSDVICSIIFDR